MAGRRGRDRRDPHGRSEGTVCAERPIPLVPDRLTKKLLDGEGYEVGRLRIVPPGESSPLYIDLWNQTNADLIEAKSTVTWDQMRQAVGQLPDYGRFSWRKPHDSCPVASAAGSARLCRISLPEAIMNCGFARLRAHATHAGMSGRALELRCDARSRFFR